jgi:hypothetical protein
LAGYGLGHLHPDPRTGGQPDATLVTPFGMAGGTLGAIAGPALGRGKSKDDVEHAAATGDLKGLVAQMFSGGPAVAKVRASPSSSLRTRPSRSGCTRTNVEFPEPAIGTCFNCEVWAWSAITSTALVRQAKFLD